MKIFFVETNADNMVVFVDDNNKWYGFDEITFDLPLTLETAITADYGNCDGCETAVDIAYAVGKDEHDVFDWDETQFESVTEITDQVWKHTVISAVESQYGEEAYRVIEYPWGIRVQFADSDDDGERYDEFDVYRDGSWEHSHGLFGAGRGSGEDCEGDNVFHLDDCRWI